MTRTQSDSDPLLLVLNPIRLKGTAERETVAEMAALSADVVEQHLEAATAESLVTYREGRRGGHRLTPEGTARHADLLAADRADEGRRRGMEFAYDGFLPLNETLKEICSAWQIRPDGTANDHTDAEYDGQVILRLADLDAAIQPALARAGELCRRMGAYGPRLAGALRRLEEGDLSAFARPMAASYHDAWMELHQDLLLSLGLERSEKDGH